MAISAVVSSATTVADTGGGNISLTSPTGTQAGDLLVVVVAEHQNTDGVTSIADTATGLRLFTKLNFGAQVSTSSTSVWYRVVLGSDPTSWTATCTAKSEAAIMAYRGVSQTTPIDAQGTTNTASTSPATFNAVTTLTAGAWYVGAFSENLATAGLNALTSGSPTPTIRANAGNGGTTTTRAAVGLIDVSIASAGSSGAFAYSLNTALAWGTFSFALRPAPDFPLGFFPSGEAGADAVYRM